MLNPVTLLDAVKAKVGEKATYSYGDHEAAGVPMLGGCYGCHATIASYNAYPGKNGYLHCRSCIGDDGFATVGEFLAA